MPVRPSAEEDQVRQMSDRSRAALERWDGTVVAARDAATVILVRGCADERPEVFMARRAATMSFAPGLSVFPGGVVQATDSDPAIPWVGPSAVTWGRALGCSAERARSVVAAAVRETFEETGVLLASADGGSSAGLASRHPSGAQDRADLEAGVVGLAELLRARNLRLRADLLGPWTRWLTPEFEPRRYDTTFLVARVSRGQEVGELSSEIEAGRWMPAAVAHRAGRSGELAMMAPTLHNLRRLRDVGEVDPLRAAWSERVPTIAPRMVEVGGSPFLDRPEDDEL